MNDTGVLRRDGHLTELGLERHLLEEALPEAASAHLSSCELCAARAQALAAVAPPPLPASLGGALTAVPELPRPANRGFAVTAAGIGFVAAAGALAWLAVPTGPPPDDAFQVRGGGVGLEVYARAETITRRVHDGDEVNAGERLGFRVSPSHDSYVVVLGVDRAGTTYPCWPPIGAAREVAAGPHALDVAVRLDDAPGFERIVAVACAEPVEYGDLAPTLAASPADEDAPLLREGCVQEELVLHKATSP